MRFQSLLFVFLLALLPVVAFSSGPPVLEIHNRLEEVVRVRLEDRRDWREISPKGLDSIMLNYQGDSTIQLMFPNAASSTQEITKDDLANFMDWTKLRTIRAEIDGTGFHFLPPPIPAWYNPLKVSPALADLALYSILTLIGFSLTGRGMASALLSRAGRRDSKRTAAPTDSRTPGAADLLSQNLRAAITAAAFTLYLAPKIPVPGSIVFSCLSLPLMWLIAKVVISDLTRIASLNRQGSESHIHGSSELR